MQSITAESMIPSCAVERKVLNLLVSPRADGHVAGEADRTRGKLPWGTVPTLPFPASKLVLTHIST